MFAVTLRLVEFAMNVPLSNIFGRRERVLQVLVGVSIGG